MESAHLGAGFYYKYQVIMKLWSH